MVRPTGTFITGAFLASALAAVALAAPSRVVEVHRSEGTLARVDPELRVVEVKTANGVETLRARAATPVFDHGRKVELRSLEPGDRLRVEWVAEAEAKIARRIEVVDAGTASG